MTIGIALSGPNAGLGIFKALAAIERISRGSVGGFVSFAVITADGRLLRAQTQDGGTSTLFGGEDPPAEYAQAPLAVLMSSGPNRPEPLSQFTPGEAELGLVTGHRLPNVAICGHPPPNVMVLDALKRGDPVRVAVSQALAANRQADAGLIALTRKGEIAMGDTDFVCRRKDRGGLSFSSEDGRFKGAVTHNSIFPVRGIAELVAGVALDTYEAPDRCDRMLRLDRSVRLVPSDGEQVQIDDQGKVLSVDIARERIEGGTLEGALFLYQAPVYLNGKLVGHVSGQEPYTIVENGRALSFSGRPETEIALKRQTG